MQSKSKLLRVALAAQKRHKKQHFKNQNKNPASHPHETDLKIATANKQVHLNAFLLFHSGNRFVNSVQGPMAAPFDNNLS